jgi:hypothetical protein
MRAVIDGGYAYEVPAEQLGQSPPWTWYLPHHGVVNPNKPGKVRLVSDAARKFAGTCLNDHLLKGPDLFTSLVGVLLRFRRSNIGLSADIASMYYQVQVPEEDQPAFSFQFPATTSVPHEGAHFRCRIVASNVHLRLATHRGG